MSENITEVTEDRVGLGTDTDENASDTAGAEAGEDDSGESDSAN